MPITKGVVMTTSEIEDALRAGAIEDDFYAGLHKYHQILRRMDRLDTELMAMDEDMERREKENHHGY